MFAYLWRNQNIFFNRMNQLLFIIDPQMDFTCPSGSLYVPKAEKAMRYLADFIAEHRTELDDICISLDSHHLYHIGHASYWQDAKGNTPAPFSQFTNTSQWKPSQAPLEQVNEYLLTLKKQGRTHTIWPNHCIIDSEGWQIDATLLNALTHWNSFRKENNLLPYKTYRKGSFADAEMFSVLSTFDGKIIDLSTLPIRLEDYDQILIAGVAEDVCVAETVHDLIRIPLLKNKIRFIKKGMACLQPDARSMQIFKTAIDIFGASYL